MKKPDRINIIFHHSTKLPIESKFAFRLAKIMNKLGYIIHGFTISPEDNSLLHNYLFIKKTQLEGDE